MKMLALGVMMVLACSPLALAEPAAKPDAQATPSTPAAPVAQVKGDTVKLTDGTSVVAPIIKETSEAIWLDLGYTLIEVPRTNVDSIQRREGGAPAPVAKSGLLRFANNLPQRPSKELAKQFGEAVVKVSTPSGTGSGFIIHPDGYAITNAHVIQGETKLRATLYLQEPTSTGAGELRRIDIDDCEIVAVNSHVDLAMIKIKRIDGKPFPYVYVQGEDELAAGQPVFAIGAPLGLERTLSSGVIATTARSFEGLTYIQTTAQINPGNSGGPLFNDRGEVIGVTNMKLTFGEGLGFAIPARYVRDFVANRDAFGYDKNNPNSGHMYMQPPTRQNFGTPEALRDDSASGSKPQ